MTYFESLLYLFLYFVIAGVGVATLRGLRDGHDWNVETAFVLGAAAVLVAWIFVTG